MSTTKSALRFLAAHAWWMFRCDAQSCNILNESCSGSLREASDDDIFGLLHIKATKIRAKDPEKRIPRLLWQTWHDTALPQKYSEGAQQLQHNNPTFSYKLVTDEDGTGLMDRYFPGNISEAYQALLKTGLGAARADLLRYALLYTFGGVYVDLDAACKDLELNIHSKDSALVSHEDWWANRWIQWVMMFERHHPILKTALEVAVKRLHSGFPATITSMHEAVVWTTGPVAFSEALRQFDEKFFNNEVDEAWHDGFGVRAVGERMQLRQCDLATCSSDRNGKFAKVGFKPICAEHAVEYKDPKKYDTIPLPANRMLVEMDKTR